MTFSLIMQFVQSVLWCVCVSYYTFSKIILSIYISVLSLSYKNVNFTREDILPALFMTVSSVPKTKFSIE